MTVVSIYVKLHVTAHTVQNMQLIVQSFERFLIITFRAEWSYYCSLNKDPYNSVTKLKAYSSNRLVTGQEWGDY